MANKEQSTTQVLRALAASGVEGAQTEPPGPGGVAIAHGSAWHKLSVPGFEYLTDIEVKVPVSATVQMSRDGQVGAVKVEPPSDESLEEVVSFVRGLAKRGEIAGHGGGLLRRPTHELVTSADGTRRLVRRGMSE